MKEHVLNVELRWFASKKNIFIENNLKTEETCREVGFLLCIMISIDLIGKSN